MPDLKQISDEIAKAIFERIEQDRTLILSNVADVIHKELAVRMPERKEQQTDAARKAQKDWEEIKKIIHEWPSPRNLQPIVSDPRWIAWDLASEDHNSDDIRENGK